MAIKNYMINDKWLDIAKENIVEVKSTDGVIGSVKVNGEEYGGGSSDFSTAEVTVVNEMDGEILWTYLPILQGDTIRTDYGIDTVGTTTYTIALYKGSAIINYGYAGETLVVVEVSGNATNNMEGQITITGDCTLTYSAGLLP